MPQGHGFLPDKLKPEDFVFGGRQLPLKVLNPFGQWDVWLPESELQKRNGLETQNCVAYGTLNCLETLLKKLLGGDYNFSERYVGIMADTTPSGNSPQKVIETIRKSGLIKEELLPFDDTIDEWGKYYSPKPMTEDLIKEGEKWLERFEVGHEWVLVGDYSGKRQDTLKEALRYSPLGISVYAWKWDGKFYVKDNEQDNHWCCLYGYKDGEYWKIFDHYDNTRKKLAWDYKFGFAKRYFIKPLKRELKQELKRGKISLLDILRKYLCHLPSKT